MTHIAFRVSSLVLAGMICVSVWALTQVPPDALVPVHFDISGQPDGFAYPLMAFFALPAIGLATMVLFLLLPRFEPRAANLARSSKAYGTFWLATILLLGFCHGLLVTNALGVTVSIPRITTALIGAFLIVTGNIAGKIRSNFVLGVRTSWTLSSERAWDRTHRVYGWSSVGLGLALLVLAALNMAPVLLSAVLFSGLFLLVVGTAVYSYRVWRRERPACLQDPR